MKTAVVFVAAILAQLSVAQPFGHGHMAAHRAAHEKREVVTVTAANAVYVDAHGHAYATGPVGGSKPTPAPAAPAANAHVEKVQAPAPQQQTASQPAPPSPGNANNKNKESNPQPSPQTPSGDAGKGSSGLGIVYSPYNADSSCKSPEQVKKDFDGFSGYGTVRSYGVDCDQVPNMIQAAKAKSMKIQLGVFKLESVDADIQKLIQGVGNNWDMVTGVSVGNELVNQGGKGVVANVVSAIGKVRGALKQTPFKGSVVTVDTYNALIANPELCQASDFAAANAHAFFDPHASDASKAGEWLKKTVNDVKKACGGKRVVITESGWPSKGDCWGSNVCPSKANQKAATDSIKAAFTSDVFLFSAYNDYWKKDFDGSHNAEKYWGIYGDSKA